MRRVCGGVMWNAGQIIDYSCFLRLLEAQSLGDVLPNLRACRTKLPHPVYQIPNYRMRQSARSGALKAWRRFSDEQEVHPR
jgi:hypothetical protein